MNNSTPDFGFGGQKRQLEDGGNYLLGGAESEVPLFECGWGLGGGAAAIKTSLVPALFILFVWAAILRYQVAERRAD